MRLFRRERCDLIYDIDGRDVPAIPPVPGPSLDGDHLWTVAVIYGLTPEEVHATLKGFRRVQLSDANRVGTGRPTCIRCGIEWEERKTICRPE